MRRKLNIFRTGSLNSSAIQRAEDAAPRSSVASVPGRARKRGAVICVAIAMGLSLTAAPPAFALSKTALTSSFAGSGADALTNPTAVAVDPKSHDLYVANPPVNQRQAVTVNSTGGTFTLTFKGKTIEPMFTGGFARPGDLAARLGTLSTIGSGNVAVTGPNGGPYTVEFTGALGGAEQPLLTANSSGLTGGTHSVDVSLARHSDAVAEVEKFTPSGEFLYMIGSEVDQTTHGDLCTAESGHECQPGALGTSPGTFTAPTYLAVDPTSGDLYVADTGDDKVSKFDSSGTLLATWSTAGQLGGFAQLRGIAADSGGNLFVLDANTVHRYSSDGESIREFVIPRESSPPDGLAVDAGDHLYDGGAKFNGAFGELLGTWDAGGEATGFAVAPSTGDLYSIQSGESVDQFAVDCPEQTGEESCPTPLESFGAKTLSEAQGIAADSDGTVYVADTGHHRIAVFTSVSVPELSTASQIKSQTGVELTGKVNPAGGEEVTECRFEYNHDVDQSWTVTLGATGTGNLTSGSKQVTGLTSQVGTFTEGEEIEAPGIPAHTTIATIGLGQLELSNAAEANSTAATLSAEPTGGSYTLLVGNVETSTLRIHSTSVEIGHALESLHNVGQENVRVIGPSGGPYTVSFVGAHADTEFQEGVLTANTYNFNPSAATVEIETNTVGVPGGSSPIAVPCLNASGQPAVPFADEQEVHVDLTGLTPKTDYHFRLIAGNSRAADIGGYQNLLIPTPPEVGTESVSEVDPDAAAVHAQIEPGGGDTHYHVEYVEEEEFIHNGGFEHAEQSTSLDAGSAETPQSLTAHLSGLKQSTTYHYRVVAENALTTAIGAAHTFTTLAFSSPTDPCPNAHVRQQTGSAGLLDCRAYELVSAANAGGYDVESNLIEGQTPFGGYPEAENHVLYGVHGGGIAGTDHPTDRGVDPYLATRGPDGWSTEYVGIPSNGTPSTAPFASTLDSADATLSTFTFGGPELCSPCFPDGSTGVPLRLPNGELTQGMSGSLDPGPTAEPAGFIAKHLSANGEHLVFGSKSKFELDANEGEISIYDRNLKTGETHVVSKTPEGHTMAEEGKEIGELDISKDGSRIVIGHLVEEKEGTKYWHLYMNIGDSNRTIDLTPGTTHGVLFDGMTSDGSKVFFSSVDHLTGHDTEHTGADIFEAEVSGEAATLHLISRGPEEDVSGSPGDTGSCDPSANTKHVHWNTIGSEENCGVVAVGGGGGVASGDGTIYFLSPEKLTGSSTGVQNAPNLYFARPADGYAPHFLATLQSTLNAPLPHKVHSFLHSFGNFTVPTGVAIAEAPGEAGDSYVFDVDQSFGGYVAKFDPSGNLLTGFAKHGKLEGPSASVHFIPYKYAPYPTSIAVDNSCSEHSPALTELTTPKCSAFDPSYRDLYVPDWGNGSVDKFSPSGAFISQIEGGGSPVAVSVDQANGDVYVAAEFGGSTGGVDVYGPEGNFLTSFETNPRPTGVAVDANGTVYLVSGGGSREAVGITQAYKPSSTSPLIYADNEIDEIDSHHSVGVAVDPENDVYVDEGTQVTEFDSAGHPIGSPLGKGLLTLSTGLAASSGNLDVSNRPAGPGENGTVAVFRSLYPASPQTDNPLVVDSVSSPEIRHTGDFQITPSGNNSVFTSTLVLASNGEETAGHTEVYRYDAGTEELTCISCTTTGTPSAGEASLASGGLSLTDDGNRVFFNTTDALVASDTDNKQDVYEWEEKGSGNCKETSPTFHKATGACLALISAGTSAFDSGLLGVDANGKDAYFFTRDSLALQDNNGPTMKVYDAREGGGFPYTYPPPLCKASDECHGASSPAPPPLQVGSESGTSHQYQPEPKECKKDYVLKHGKCVKKPKHHHKHHRRGSHKLGGKK